MALRMRGAAASIYSGFWSFGQAMGIAVISLVVGFIECMPAIIAFGCALQLLNQSLEPRRLF
jgi:hypothetical protein